MYNDYGGIAAGLGVGMFFVVLVVYLAIVALTIWIGYLIMRTAVKNGILRADEERARRAGPGAAPGAAPRPYYPSQPPR